VKTQRGREGERERERAWRMKQWEKVERGEKESEWERGE